MIDDFCWLTGAVVIMLATLLNCGFLQKEENNKKEKGKKNQKKNHMKIEINNIPDKEFKVMTIKILIRLEKSGRS